MHLAPRLDGPLLTPCFLPCFAYAVQCTFAATPTAPVRPKTVGSGQAGASLAASERRRNSCGGGSHLTAGQEEQPALSFGV